MPSQSSAATRERTAATSSALGQPMAAARTGVRAGETRPPTLLPVFMIPPPAPLLPPAISVIVAQNGPSTDNTSAVERASAAAASQAFVARAPSDRKTPARA